MERGRVPSQRFAEQTAAYSEGVVEAATEMPGSDLGWILGVILRSWHERVGEAVADVPHGLRGFQILSVVGHNDPPTQIGLARHLGIDKTVMPYVIDALVDAGLIERRVDLSDRRVRRIAITETGRAALERLEREVHAAEDAVFEGVDPSVRQAFLRQAGSLAVSIHQAQPNLDPCLAVRQVLTDAVDDPAASSH